MDLLRLDVLSIFDLAVDSDKEAEQLAGLLSAENPKESRMRGLLNDSYDWIFYEDQYEGFALYDISHLKRSEETVGMIVRFNRTTHIGTYTVWRKYIGQVDPLERKKRSWDDAQADVAALEELCPEVRVERQYPFIALELRHENLKEACQNSREYLGRIFTGDHENERSEVLRSYIDRDLSQRSYELLLIRWTEALAVYSHIDNQEFYEKCFLRAMQVFEHCILGRATLRSIEEKARALAQRLANQFFVLTPAIWAEEHRVETWFLEAEQIFAASPKVQSVEADRLVSRADIEFGIAKAVLAAKAQVENVRSQAQWAKAQTLAAIGVATYVIDKLIGWETLRNAVLRLGRG